MKKNEIQIRAKELFDERAGQLEFDANLKRALAERRARVEIHIDSDEIETTGGME